MAANLSRAESEGINEINITPFVDIVLVLLIVFMISTPAMMYRGMKVQLPAAVNAQDMGRVTLKVAVLTDGTTQLDGHTVTREQLRAAALKIRENKMRGDALIQADKMATHGSVMEVFDLLKAEGLDPIGFGTSTVAKSRK
jgi:biopolymer transport protein ExbD